MPVTDQDIAAQRLLIAQKRLTQSNVQRASQAANSTAANAVIDAQNHLQELINQKALEDLEATQTQEGE